MRETVVLVKCLCFIVAISEALSAPRHPHVIMIVADDLGWNDVGFHGSDQIPTPNLDALAYSGVILNNYYVNPICSPSRSALMTGYHPIHTGMQSNVVIGAAPWGLTLEKELLPEYLNFLNYTSHLVGKWHLGNFREAYTPLKRGFKSHVGYWTGHMDYYDHTAQELYGPVDGWGHDFRRNMSVAWEDYGTYSTEIFTREAVDRIEQHDKDKPMFLYLAHQAVHSANSYAPLQAPSSVVDKFSYIADPNRRQFAGMLHLLDESVGRVVEVLQARDMLRHSLIVFSTDNGGPAAGYDDNYASNWPLRGVKATLWEGGVRGAAFVWSPKLKVRSRVAQQMMNVQDWLPTIYSAIGGDPSKLPAMDGMDIWTALSEDTNSPRTLMLHNIDDTYGSAGLRVGDWKLKKGTMEDGQWNLIYGPSGRDIYPACNFSAILSSPAGLAVRAAGVPLPSITQMKSLRGQAEVKCAINPGLDAKPCKELQEVCLFNITADPCEQYNLALERPSVVRFMKDTLAIFNKTAVPPANKPIDPRADPKFFDYTWTNWLDFYEPLNETETLKLFGDKKGRSVNSEMYDPFIQGSVKERMNQLKMGEKEYLYNHIDENQVAIEVWN